MYGPTVVMATRADSATRRTDARSVTSASRSSGSWAPSRPRRSSRLARRGVEANARECRQVSEGLSIMRARRRAGTLPRVVIFALGANWRVTPGDIAGALRIVGAHRIVVLVTHRATGGGAGPDRGL